MLLARNAEHVAGRDEDVRPLQQRLAELAGRKPGFLHAREQIERALRRDKAQIRELFQPLGRVENTLAVGGNVRCV